MNELLPQMMALMDTAEGSHVCRILCSADRGVVTAVFSDLAPEFVPVLHQELKAILNRLADPANKALRK